MLVVRVEVQMKIFPAVSVLKEPLATAGLENSCGEARESTNIKPADFSEQDSRGGRGTFL